jgi:hexosaminidase
MNSFAVTCGADPTQPPISLSWRLVDNLADNRFHAELTLTNEADAPLQGDWALYFNSALRLIPASVSGGFVLTHINGDFFVLRPDPAALPIRPRASRTIQWQGAPWALNVSDAPSGFYFVPDDHDAEQPITIPVPLLIGPFPDAAQLKRGTNDMVPVVTAESRFLANETLNLIPPDELIKVVPTPCEITSSPGIVVIRSSTVICWEPPLGGEAEYLAAQLQVLRNAPLTVKRGLEASKDTIRLRIGDISVNGSPRSRGAEAYLLVVSPESGIEIVGTDPAGVFYGLQTLRALLPLDAYRQPRAELQFGAVRIADAPRFKYRGVHLDVARNFQSKETVKKLLDLMSLYKLNHLHWHLTDDEGWRIDIRALPELTEVGARRGHTTNEANHLFPSYGSGPFADAESSPGNGFYSQDDLVELLQFAHARHIAVIPELDFPGHARAAVKAMEARHRHLSESGDPAAADEILLREPNDPSKYESVQMWRDNVVDVGRDATYRFLATVVGELSGIYRRAGVPLERVHLGGDEVPAGVWDESPTCKRLPLDAASKIPRRGQLELHFLDRASEILAHHSIKAACWEDCLLPEITEKANAGGERRAAGKPAPTAYVWNNVWGWGREDAAYRLANAGFDVVLCNATHLYFDLACEKAPDEPGYYWAGFVDSRAPFELIPLDVFKNAGHDGMGRALAPESFANRVRLTHNGEQHILGIQGQLWGENLRSREILEYIAFPRLIALAERAWAKSPGWAQIEGSFDRARLLDLDWNQFANRVGQLELPRLDYLAGGVQYRLPPPGAVVRSGMLYANVAFPGLQIRYTNGGTEPTVESALYDSPVALAGTIKLKTFDTRGRGSRTVTVQASAGM